MHVRTEVRRPQREFPRFPVAVSLLGFLPSDEVAGLLADRRDALDVEVDRLTGELDAGARLPRVLLLEVELQLTMARAERDWSDRILGELREGTLAWRPEELRSLSNTLQDP